MNEMRVPEGWEIKRLGQLGKVVTGSTPSTKEPSYWGGGIPFVSPADFDERVYVGSTVRTVTDKGASKGRVLPKDSVLVTCIGSLGGIAMSSEVSVTNQQINAVVPSDINDNKFTYYNILFHIDELERNAGTTTLPIINKSTFEGITVPVPPLPEQQKIASILTSVDEVIEKTQSQINKLQDLKKGTMNELLTRGIGHTEFKDSPVGRIPKGWEVKNIGSLGKVVTGNTPKTNESDNYNGHLPFVSPADVTDEMVVRRTKTTITEKGLKQTRELPPNTVMVVCIGSTIGKVGMTSKVCGTNQQINSIISEKNNPQFIYFLMKLFSGKIKSLAGTQAVPIINKSEFSSILVQVPSINEQEKIASILSSIDKNIEEKQRKLTQIQSLKKSLMQDLLTGKKRVMV